MKMKSNEFYWVAFKEDRKQDTKPAQMINGDMYIVGYNKGVPLELLEVRGRVKTSNNMKTVYIAGAYRWRGNRWIPAVIGELINIYRAWDIARQVWLAGFAAVCPHTNGLLMDRFGGTPEMFLKGDLDILRQCDYILMMPEWKKSAGATEERAFAMEVGIPVFYSLKDLQGESAWL